MTIDVPKEAPQGNILNYSIVSSDEDVNPLVLKFKISSTNKVTNPKVKRLEDWHQYTIAHREKHTVNSSQESIESSPNKRNRSDKLDNEELQMVSPRKLRRSTRTPKKYSHEYNVDELCSTMHQAVSLRTPNKKREVTPQRRSSRFLDKCTASKNEELELTTPTKRQQNNQETPRKSFKIDLNESIRRALLKNHNIENNSTPQRVTRAHARKSYKSFYEDGRLDDNDQIFETLTRNEIEINSNRRILRSRKASVDSTNSFFDEDFTIEKKSANETPKKSTPYSSKSRKSSVTTARANLNTPKTPRNRLKMLRDGIITPTMHSRASIVPKDNTPLMKARSQLHVSYIPTSLPCREKEYLEVYNFLKGKLEDKCGGCMYISGVPGTGKTATVTSVIDHLREAEDIPSFNYVSINGMRLTEPRQSYVEIWKQLTGKTVPWEQAQSLLEERFTKRKKLEPIVMLIDELDILCTKRQDVVYNLLDWPTKCKDQLIVITIANTMDLPERLLMSRVTSRLGLTRLTFQAYTHKQLIEIVTKRLLGTNSFNSDAVQLVARKVASVSGDARRALDICRRAAEIAEDENNTQLVNIDHVNQALTSMITQPQVQAIKNCSRLQKLLLQAIVAEIERTGVEETSFIDVFKMLVSCCALDGFKMVTITAAQRALYQLSASKLLLTDQKCSDIYQRIILNVSIHDVYFALKQDN